MSLPRESDPGGEIDDGLKVEPDGLHAGLAITIARQEAAEHGHQAHHIVEPAQWGQGEKKATRRWPMVTERLAQA